VNKQEFAELLARVDDWPRVLEAAGVGDSYFGRRNGPCPICGGKDRYRWNHQKSAWVCSQCTGNKYSSGFNLLVELLGGFVPAKERMIEVVGGSARKPARLSQVRSTEPINEEEQRKRNFARMQKIWEAARPYESGDPVDLYLQRRVPGLDRQLNMVRFHPALEYWLPPEKDGGKFELLGKFPAMLAKAFDSSGRFVQLHKTYLSCEGAKADVPVAKKLEKGVGVNGFAVPIMPLEGGRTLGFAEGIESAVAGAMLKRIPVWPCLNGPSMASFELPAKLVEQLDLVVVFEDHDERKELRARDGSRRFSEPGREYAERMVQNMRRAGKRVMIVKAAKVGRDMADHWTSLARAA
jgi:putative DNA primase/helicase